MKFKLSLLTAFSLFTLTVCKGSVSPEAKLTQLAPKFQKVMCSKTIECTKDEFAKIPPAYRNMIPPFMQSEESCMTFFKEKMAESEKQRMEKKEEVTMDMVNAFETCIAAMEKTTCELYKSAKGNVSIPGCEKMESFSK